MKKQIIFLTVLLTTPFAVLSMNEESPEETQRFAEIGHRYIALRNAKQGYEEQALEDNWFGGDKKKIKRELKGLLTVPAVDWEPARELRQEKLIEALRKEDEEAARDILSKKRKVNVNCYTDQGGTPLGIAVGHSLSLVALLLEYGADPNMPYATSWTPLASAAAPFTSNNSDQLTTIKLLLAHGARMCLSTLGDQRGTSPLSSFYGPKNIPLVRLLLTHVHTDEVQPVRLGEMTKEQAIADIIERRMFLLCRSMKVGVWKYNCDEPCNKPLSDALCRVEKDYSSHVSRELFKSTYEQAITDNVDKLLKDD